MFNTLFNNSTDLLTQSSEYLTQFPKTYEEAIDAFKKVKAVFDSESKNSREMWEIYAKAATGDATPNQIAEANKKAQELLVTARFATMVSMPGSIFFLPLLVKMAKDAGVDLIPASVAKEFGI